MAHVSEAVLLGYCVGPGFDRGTLDFDGEAAGSADHMVMMAGALPAPAVERLAVAAGKDINVTLLGHRLKGPVDRGEAHILALGPEQVV